MSQPPLVLIVILNWNSAAATLAAVASLASTDYERWRILVIDNGSTDGSFEALKPLASDRIEVVARDTNTGFTGGCNLGLRRALEIDAAYVWLLNNDAVVEPGTLSSLVAVAESDPKVGLVSPLITDLDDPRKVIIAGAIFDRAGRQHADTHDLEVAKRWSRELPDACIVHGTAMLVPARLIRAIGVLDDSLFAYYEDVDYSLRSIDAGFRNVIDWNCRVLHANKNMYRRPNEIKPHYWYYMARNEIRLWRRYLGFLRSVRMNWWATVRFLRLRSQLSDHSAGREANLAGIWHGWMGRTGPYRLAFRAPRWVHWLADLYTRRSASQRTGRAVNTGQVK